jgi:hypothetical protein
MIKNTCVFVSSSDNTFDVFLKIYPNLLENWPSSNIDLFVGLNSKVADYPFSTVSAQVCGWRLELHAQILQLPENYKYIILLLDDFYFYEPVDISYLKLCIDYVQNFNIEYLRLHSLQRSIIGSLFLKIFSYGHKIIRISEGEPYYSSLQVAIWDRSYLLKLLDIKNSIWDFEHTVIPKSKHYVVAGLGGLNYEHLVEKGRWLRHAPRLLANIDSAYFHTRGFDARPLYRFKFLRKIKFHIYGYTFFKIKRLFLFTKNFINSNINIAK